MSFGIEIDGARELSADMKQLPATLVRHIIPINHKAGVNIKKQLKDEMGGSTHFKGVTRSISYDIIEQGMGVEVGPSAEPGSAGNLANIAYFGGSNGGGGTVSDPLDALEAEIDGYQTALADLIEDFL